MNDPLKQAIERGEAAKKAKEAEEKLRKEKEASERVRASKATRERWRAELVRIDLYKTIEEAVARGETRIGFPRGCRELADVINSDYPGVHAQYSYGHDHINSDEVKEDWEYVEVT